jgi:hypothetical protein
MFTVIDMAVDYVRQNRCDTRGFREYVPSAMNYLHYSYIFTLDANGC